MLCKLVSAVTSYIIHWVESFKARYIHGNNVLVGNRVHYKLTRIISSVAFCRSPILHAYINE